MPDLNGDGRHELAFDGSFGMGGENSRSLTFASFGPNGLADLGTTMLGYSACAAGRDGSEAVRILAAPGPRYIAERFRQASCDDTDWTRDGPAQALTLDASETAYVDLPLR